MNEIEIYLRVKAAIERSEEMGFKVTLNSNGARLGIYEAPFQTANEMHHYLNGIQDGRRKMITDSKILEQEDYSDREKAIHFAAYEKGIRDCIEKQKMKNKTADDKKGGR